MLQALSSLTVLLSATTGDQTQRETPPNQQQQAECPSQGQNNRLQMKIVTLKSGTGSLPAV